MKAYNVTTPSQDLPGPFDTLRVLKERREEGRGREGEREGVYIIYVCVYVCASVSNGFCVPQKKSVLED